MATQAGFKQQCPSCEAMVPVKDHNLIGRKIDCPNCKYRFIVEEPEPEPVEEVAEEPAGKKGRAKDDAKPDKAGPRRADEDEDEEEDGDAPKKKAKSGSSKTLIIGGVMAAVVLAALGVGAFVMMGDSAPNAPRPGGAGAGGAKGFVPPPAPDDSGAPKAGAAAVAAVSANLVEVSDQLPPDTENVLNLNFKDLLKSPIGRAATSPGAFREKSIEERFGIALADLDRVLIGTNDTHNWVYAIIRSNKPIPWELIQTKLGFKPAAGGPILGQAYFTTEARLAGAGPNAAAQTVTLAGHLRDRQTLIVASLAPMQELLKVKGQFPIRPRQNPASAGVPAVAAAAGAAGGQAKAAPAAPRSRDAEDGTLPSLVGRGPAGPAGAAAPVVRVPSRFYQTVPYEVKALLDQVENNKTVLLSLAGDVKLEKLGRLLALGGQAGDLQSPYLQTALRQTDITKGGLALRMTDSVDVDVALRTKTERSADKLARDVRGGLEALAAIADKAPPSTFKMPVILKWLDLQRPATPAFNAGGFGVVPPAIPGGIGGNQPPPPDAPPVPSCVFDASQENETVLLTINLHPDEKQYQQINADLQLGFVLASSSFELNQKGSYWSRLATAAAKLPDAYPNDKHFPRGAYERRSSDLRVNIPWPAIDRVSWMAQLLPHIGHESLYEGIKWDQSWRDPANRNIAASIVPEFLDAAFGESTFLAQVGGFKFPVGATHFVGNAGIGIDAAEYPDNDPAYAKKLGVFGYNRVTRVSDIKDGVANTIVMFESPHFRRPWMAGGGATVQGVPESNSMRAFLLPPAYAKQHDGKKGIYVMMADGAVRFVADTVADDVIKGMSTIRGEEDMNLRLDAPVVKPDEARSALKTQSPVPSARPPVAPPAAKEAPKVEAKGK